MARTEPETREITVICDECGVEDSFTTDNMSVEVGECWEQECTNDDCTHRYSTIVDIQSY